MPWFIFVAIIAAIFAIKDAVESRTNAERERFCISQGYTWKKSGTEYICDTKLIP